MALDIDRADAELRQLQEWIAPFASLPYLNVLATALAGTRTVLAGRQPTQEQREALRQLSLAQDERTDAALDALDEQQGVSTRPASQRVTPMPGS